MAFEKKNTVIVGVSRDSIKSHKRFIDKEELGMVLLSDGDSALCDCFGVIKEKMNYGKKYFGIDRSTFVLDEQGEILKEFRSVKVDGHVGEVYGYVAGLE